MNAITGDEMGDHHDSESNTRWQHYWDLQTEVMRMEERYAAAWRKGCFELEKLRYNRVEKRMHEAFDKWYEALDEPPTKKAKNTAKKELRGHEQLRLSDFA